MYTLHPETTSYADSLCVQQYGISFLTLMKNAAKSCYDYIYPLISAEDKIVILCGKGNNGGDGYELATLLKKGWFNVTVINVFDCLPNSEAARTVFDECLKSGVDITAFCEWKSVFQKATVIIDALFGVGFHGNIDKESAIGEMLDFCNTTSCIRIAIDTPSGINSADGRTGSVVFKANFTITMAFIKTGMLSYPAREYCGKILIADIGYPENLCDKIEKHALVVDDDYFNSVIPKSKSDSHKGNFGRLLMYCGSPNMTGAAVLAASAALRSGAGLVNIARDKETIKILQNHLVEPIFSVIPEGREIPVLDELSKKASSFLIGCGMGQSEIDKNVLFHFIKNAQCNLIIDADGINLLCENKLILREAKKIPVLTPHPLEFARLCGKSVNQVQNDRINLAQSFSKQYNCVLVLKGASTVICSPDGRLAINTSGNSGLSKGGSGDVLSGIIASLCTQGIGAFESAATGVYLHGKAADILADEISEYGLLPSDIPKAVAKLLP